MAAPTERDLFSMLDEPQTTSALSELVLRLIRQLVMHNPIEGCRINGNRKRWDRLPADKSLYGTNHLPMLNGYLEMNGHSDIGTKGSVVR